MKSANIIPTILITISLTIWVSVLAAKQWDLPWSIHAKAQVMAAKAVAATDSADAAKSNSSVAKPNSEPKHDDAPAMRKDTADTAVTLNFKNTNPNVALRAKAIQGKNKESNHPKTITMFDLL